MFTDAARSVRVGAFLATVTMLSACLGSSTPPAQSSIAGGSVVQRIQGGWPTLDPQAQGSADSYQIIGGFYDYLLALRGTKVEPYLATAWTVSPTSIKFTIRKDATCSDGTPLTVAAVAASFRRLLNTVADTTFPAVKALFGPSPYVITEDDAASTMTVSIARPFSGLVYAFTDQNPNSGIVCPKGLANPSTLATVPAGSGPFTLASQVSGDSITLAARPDWHWGPEGASTKSSGFPQTLTYRVITNDTTAANLLTTGGLDVAQVLGTDNSRLIADKSLIHRTAHPYESTDVIFNQTSGRPTADQPVRQALSAAIDRTAFGLAAYNGYGMPASSLLSPDAQCYDSATEKLVPNGGASKAKQIMSAAGYQPGSDGTWQNKTTKQPLLINIAGGTNTNNGADYLADAFTAAGFAVKLNKTDRATYSANYLGGNFDVAISTVSAPTPDANGGNGLALYVGAARPNGSNATRRDYPDIDSEVAAANATTGADSCKHWANVQELLLKNNIIMPTVVPEYQWYGRGVDFVPGFFVSATTLRRVK